MSRFMSSRNVVGLVGLGSLGWVLVEAFGFGLPSPLEFLWMALLAVAYVTIPVVVIAGFVSLYFRLTSWRRKASDRETG